MTTCARCGLKRGKKEDPEETTPRCNRCFELTDDNLRAVLGALKHREIEWDDGSITMTIQTFAELVSNA